MFKKDIDSQSKSLLGNKDLKLLRQSVHESFPSDDNTLLDTVFSGIWYRLVQQSPKATIYLKGTEPLFFDPHNKGSICPTLYFLLQVSDILPSLVIHPEASRYILSGADVMLPSVLRPASTGCYGGLSVNKLMSVRVQGNPYPFAIGTCLMTEDEFKATRGKILKVLHRYEDQLWKIGPGNSPNSGFTSHEITPLKNMVYVEDPKWYFESYIGGSTQRSPSHDRGNSQLETSISDMPQDNSTTCDINSSPIKRGLDPKTIPGSKNLDKESLDGENSISDECSSLEIDEKKLEFPIPDSDICEHADDYESKDEALCNLGQSDIENLSENQKNTFEVDHEKSIEALNLDSAEVKEAVSFCLLLLLIYTFQKETNMTFPIPISAVFSKMTTYTTEARSNTDMKKYITEKVPTFARALLSDSTNLWSLKNSHFKTLSKFFQNCAKLELLSIKKMKNEGNVAQVHRNSSYFQEYQFSQNTDECTEQQSATMKGANSNKPNQPTNSAKQQASESNAADFTFVVCYKTKSHGTSAILDKVKPDIQQMYYSAKQCENAFFQYVNEHQLESLQKPDTLILDANLLQFCMSKAERKKIPENSVLPEGATLDMQEALSKFISALQIYHGIKKSGDAKMTFYRDELKPIEISVENRHRKRFVTIIKNTQSYNIEEKTFIELLQKTLASSASSQAIPGSSKKCILVQGSFAVAVKKILMQQFGLPAKFIILVATTT